MPVGAYSQDVQTRIVNVQWGGGPVFVYGTLTDDALYYVGVTSADSKPDQQTIIPPGPGNPDFGFSAYGSSYNVIVKNEGAPNEERIPVFLICGNKSERIDGTDDSGNPITMLRYYTMIYYSNDGLSWTIVRHQDGNPTWPTQIAGANPAALVWDKGNGAFFYDQNYNISDTLTDQIFRSSDGKSWSEVSSTPTFRPGYHSAFLTHCAGNDCVDLLEQHVPDGVMSTPGAITAKPVKPPIIDYAAGFSSVNVASGDPQETWGGDQIQISAESFDADGKPTMVTKTVSVPGVKKVFCVAVAGGVIMAGGAADIAGDTGAVAISFDLGTTWKAVASRASSVTTMVANARL